MPDAGIEGLVNVFPDIIEPYIDGDAGDGIVGAGDSAVLLDSLRIHAPNHVWDLITWAVLWVIPWFGRWFADIKRWSTS